MSQRCVILYGAMGAGKTTVGRELADMLGYKFVDVDDLIVGKVGKSIPEIFEQDGEPRFREIEAEAISELSGAQGLVIAPGGGAVLDPQNRHVFRSIGLTVYLKASARELYQRIKNDTNRPLLTQAADPKAEMARILAAREQYYKDADIVIDTEDLSVEEVTNELIDELAKRTLGDG